jgi:nucleolin
MASEDESSRVGEEGEKTEHVETDKKRRRRKRNRNKKNAEDQEGEKVATPQLTSIESERSSQVDRTVFVEGIPYTAKPDDIREFFQQHGLEDIEDVRLPVWQDTGRLRGFGHVVFTSLTSKDKALALSGKYLQNRYLSISAANKPKEQRFEATSSEPSKKIMLKNLSYEATEEDIQAALEKYGRIVEGGVRVVRHSVGERRSKGFAYVEFESIESAKKVMQQKIVIHNRQACCDYDHGRVKGSFRTADGRYWQKEYGHATDGRESSKKQKV